MYIVYRNTVARGSCNQGIFCARCPPNLNYMSLILLFYLFIKKKIYKKQKYN